MFSCAFDIHCSGVNVIHGVIASFNNSILCLTRCRFEPLVVFDQLTTEGLRNPDNPHTTTGQEVRAELGSHLSVQSLIGQLERNQN